MITRAPVVEKIGYAEYKPLLDAFVERLKRKLGEQLVSAVLYGSVARGTARPDSDIDVLVVIEKEDKKRSGEKLVREVGWRLSWTRAGRAACKRGLEGSVSTIVFTRAEADQNHYLYLDMTREAILLFDRNDFFKTRLKKMKARMRELGSKRIWLRDGTWYWDIKPDLRVGEVFEL